MGWFWADTQATAPAQQQQPPISPPAACPRSRQGRDGSASPDATPPPACPMHKRTIEALGSAAPSPSSCPVPHGGGSTTTTEASSSTLSRLNPLNYMFRDLSQAPAPNQAAALPTSREESTIPKGGGTSGNWEYPSPQQMYNALLRKGYSDTDVTAVESMVAVHNFLNEGAWAEIVEWERRFGRGLRRGWDICRRGEENADETARRFEIAEARAAGSASPPPPTLVRFQGRPKDMTPKAAMVQVMGWLYPAKFGTEPPFDRHDWYVSRNIDGKQSEVRYVIDYYSGPPEPTGEPVFYLDVRPAMTPTGAVERLMRWGGDVWWRGTGGEVRETQAAASRSTK